MRAPAVVTNRLDALDTERFEAMLASPPFALLKARIAAELERARADCETHDERVVIARAQGQVKAFRTVLALPEIMLKEMKK
jgi:hypothetical protein